MWLLVCVLPLQNETRNAVTYDNLDDKIEQALASEVLDDFIIAPRTGEMRTITFKNLP